MSKAEILAEIPKLTKEEREEIRRTLDELDDSLTPEELALVDARMEAHRRDPASAIPIEEVKASLRARFAR
jgi:putative addiction module component (TIGR02574 family)